ncbi:MAG: hypothetical protein US49_C0006G0086 [candidate division TM6 bacterium GW2011_GWF2_37_49]|nr:MAG: hypothetical protein US49_C0006G0086 [candidate division TM6 bacterium GW2011_GWF2_37_49]
MKNFIHKDLAGGRWFEFSLIEQLANIGSDIERTIKWKQKGNVEYSNAAFERALELIFLTVEDPKNRSRLREILRAREALIDHFMFDNEYNSTDNQWQKYFFQFNYAAALQRGR